jgi:hypothetical protein
MKRILASLFVTSVAICSASAANAQSATSVHSGAVAPGCTISAAPGILSGTGAVPTSINSTASPGSFTTICNSTHSFAVTLLPGTKPSSIVNANYAEKFSLNAPASYTAINTTSFGSTFTTVTGLPASPAAGYVVGVTAEASLVDGAYLPASAANGYVINVRATVTPG